MEQGKIYKNTKLFWIDNIKHLIDHYAVNTLEIPTPDYAIKIIELESLILIENFAFRIRNEVFQYKSWGFGTYAPDLSKEEEKQKREALVKDAYEIGIILKDVNKTNEQLVEELREEEELVDIKNKRIVEAKETIDNLKKEVSKWKTKYYEEKKRVIYHGLQLAKDQGKIKKLRESETELKKRKGNLNKLFEKKMSNMIKPKNKRFN